MWVVDLAFAACSVADVRPRAKVCYSWWALASLAILGRSHWIDGEALTQFILSAQVSPFSVFLRT